jgi:ectoine hydroxylase-related dioxygenase (phytanoyl-CoA dioxygenase family)
VTISDEKVKQYHEQGYAIFEGVLDAEQLEGLRRECGRFVEQIEAEMDAAGVDTLDLSHRDRRYFVANRHPQSAVLRAFLFSELMAQIVGAALGDEAYLFVEQFVVKASERGMSFSWHQDGGFIPYAHTPYLSCWITLDDVSEENGTVYMLPYDRAGTRDYVPHVRDPETHDMVGYHGDDPGIPVVVPAGSVAIFSSTTLHRSGANTTPAMRRVYLAQYSPEPILNAEGTAPRRNAVPFLRGGRRVAGTEG